VKDDPEALDKLDKALKGRQSKRIIHQNNLG
jgi:hypothetical protein